MNWLETFSNRADLAIHRLVHPDTKKQQIHKTVEEKNRVKPSPCDAPPSTKSK